MSAELTGPVSAGTWVPLTLTFFSDADAVQSYRDTSFLFLVLDEHGQQVNCQTGAFVFSEVSRAVELQGKVSTYKPRMVINHYCKNFVVGHKYQLVSVMTTAGLASSIWFTLAN